MRGIRVARSRVILVLLFVASGALGTAIWVSDSRTPPPSDRTTGHLDGSTSEVLAYLEGPGRLILDFRNLSAPLTTLHEVEEGEQRAVCERVGKALDASVSPDALYTAAIGVPDSNLVELLVDDRSARSEALVACWNGDPPALREALRSLRTIDELVRRRLEA